MTILKNIPSIFFTISFLFFIFLLSVTKTFATDFCYQNGGACGSTQSNSCLVQYSDCSSGQCITLGVGYCAANQVCDQSLYDNRATGLNGCIAISNLYCKCDSPGSTGGSFGCWTVPNAKTGSDFKRNCSSNETCSSSSNANKTGWPCAPILNVQTCINAGGGACTAAVGANPICTALGKQTTQISSFSQNSNICGPSQPYCIVCASSPSSAKGVPTASCGAGNNNGADNGWCGTDNNVYYCYNYAWHIKTPCSNGCQVNEGAADTCTGTNSGGNTSGGNSSAYCGDGNSPGGFCWPGSSTGVCVNCISGGYYVGQDCGGGNVCCKSNGSNSCHTAAAPINPPVPSPTATPIPIATPTPGPTLATLGVKFEGIDALNNSKPKHLQRLLTIYLYTTNAYNTDPTSGHPTYKATDTITFQAGNPTSSRSTFRIFATTEFQIGKILSGDYYILLKSPEGSLRKLVSTNKIHLEVGKNNVIVDISNSNFQSTIPELRMGDINNDNLVNIIDYNNIIDCYQDKVAQSSCTNHNAKDTQKGLFADVNDDGVVDGIDYNMILRNMDAHGN